MEQNDNIQDSNNNQAIELADLEAPRAEEIKGGPVFMKLGDVKGETTAQTREHILLARQVG